MCNNYNKSSITGNTNHTIKPYTFTTEQEQKWKSTKTIGIIGLGDMGLLYATKLSENGWDVVCCDKADLYPVILEKYGDNNAYKFKILKDGHLVSRVSDYIIYSVEAEHIDKIVKEYGPSTKLNSIVGGQTSCKNQEISSFEKYLPLDIDIISLHSLHGPKVDTRGQPLVMINHRVSNKEHSQFVRCIIDCFESRIVYLTALEHDKITADTQAVTHAAFLSMGVAWYKRQTYPWCNQDSKWCGGLENAKINISLRIYMNKWHVYAGLAITNPAAHQQILQYATSATELFTLMIENKREKLIDRIMKAREFVFGNQNTNGSKRLLLDDSLLIEFNLNKNKDTSTSCANSMPNTHLSLLAIVDSWYQLNIIPYDHMICSTPLFRIFLGVSEYLFHDKSSLLEILDASLNTYSFRGDDLEFVIAARNWSQIVSHGDFELYRKTFEETQKFFEPMFPEANRIGNEMIKTILNNNN
ncbi:probable Prephenate dehydrogenase [NADP(+)] [Saccharomycodes ludwigii]|uniref:Probable Prephenate dehydrogenase [NADP(+)] n=1 Tax=Saccharomycodes ludwigii TaxID=36035 RepID=A0A376BBH1_9ASCO|nr:hypothetical protein SCDLUD_002068 [Saccharomycodes ludwigii]KAH3902251.1 hypothetical protein SCDLUD_002068 [Saccharomycodes ludwigii]SSD61977.1 probable Prephenate dehydrogenase [NADP(+)] [Saccharomycodes ludwigii]